MRYSMFNSISSFQDSNWQLVIGNYQYPITSLEDKLGQLIGGLAALMPNHTQWHIRAEC